MYCKVEFIFFINILLKVNHALNNNTEITSKYGHSPINFACIFSNMTILINTISDFKKNSAICHHFYIQFIYAIAELNLNNQFILIKDEFLTDNVAIPENIVVETFKSPANFLTSKVWNTYQLPSLIKKYQPDQLIQINSFFPIKSIMPSYLLLDGINCMNVIKKNSVKIFNQTKKIVVSSQHFKNEILKQFPVDPEKIEVIYHATKPAFFPVDLLQKEMVKSQFTDGKEYFLCNAAHCFEKDLILILKAFSKFKKWLKTNMRLIIINSSKLMTPPFSDSLETYKYRSEVIILNKLDENSLVNLVATAYCMILPGNQSNYVDILQAMQCQVPSIAFRNEILEEICEDAILFTEKEDQEGLAKNMMLIYKDEGLRNKTISNGSKISGKYCYDNMLNNISKLLQLSEQ